MPEKPDVPQRTLALMVLKTLDLLGPLHGYGMVRRARFYCLTRAGHKRLRTETRDWDQTAAIIARFFAVQAEHLA